jgi:hypothetical protein
MLYPLISCSLSPNEGLDPSEYYGGVNGSGVITGVAVSFDSSVNDRSIGGPFYLEEGVGSTKRIYIVDTIAGSSDDVGIKFRIEGIAPGTYTGVDATTGGLLYVQFVSTLYIPINGYGDEVVDDQTSTITIDENSETRLSGSYSVRNLAGDSLEGSFTLANFSDGWP